MTRAANKISQERVRELFDYSPLTGRLIWKASLSNRAPIGSSAGGFKQDSKGYYRVTIEGVSFGVHRLIWIWHNGEIPDGYEIDHRDLDRMNNRIENLRLATPAQNNVNKRTSNKLGLKGVKKNGKSYQARIRINGQRINIGTFSTPEEAHAAYLERAKKEYGEFVNVA